MKLMRPMSWALTARLEKTPQAVEMRYYRRLQNISYKDHVTSEEVRRKIQATICKHDVPLTLVFYFSKDDSAGYSARKNKKRDGKTILWSGQGWTLLTQLGQLKTGLGGKGLL